MLSNTSRWATCLTAILYAIPGFLLFILSMQLAPVFGYFGLFRFALSMLLREGTGLRRA